MSNDEATTNEEAKRFRLHPLTILFSLGKSVKDFIIPIVIIFVLNNGESMFTYYARIAIGLFFLYILISSFLHWLNFRYSFNNNELQVNQGRFVRKKRFIQLEKIQGVQLNTHFLYRPFGLTSVTLDTAASSSDASIKLELIKRSEAEYIKKYIASYNEKPQDDESSIENDTEIGEGASVKQKPEKTLHYKIRGKDIVFAAFTSTSFIALIPILFGLFSQFGDFINVEEYVTEAYQMVSQTVVLLVITIIGLIIISLLFGLVTTYLTYGNYQVEANEERIFVKKGVLTQSEWTIAKKKVQAVKFTKTFVRRWFGIVGVELVCAGSYGDDKVESTMLVPFMSEKKAMKLLPEVLPEFQVEENMNKLPKQALYLKLLRPSYFWLIATAVLIIFWSDKWYFSPILLAVIILLRIADYVHSRYGLFHPFIQMRSGSFSVEMFLAEKRKIEELSISQSKLQKLFGLSTLKIATRGTPVQHADIQDIPLSEAIRYYEWYAEGRAKKSLSQNEQVSSISNFVQ
ncbi:PH domain-containing protein [Alkalihalobacillus trypoxylicola]|uniref:YdbS-like PH domain-containing protein n=1 Tax=Alkalihalobacillus trypoxylicola TaxID=519424 RepID=A0A162F2D3_9BACI|nr:PH domain-containing protein [Alkalihalobacillus trypoxylicola]KYG34335.1 hypothetical protein AZF04_14170 [Alkalihalobacillus trypoxylicola]